MEVCNYRTHGIHPSYGSAITTLGSLIRAENNILNIKKDDGELAGTITLNRVELIEKPCFVDYLRSGWNINMSVAIDFTASNGELSDENSLHR